MKDSEIVDLYWQRSERAIQETDHKYGRYCAHIAFAVCSDRLDAEECVNDTWLRAWNAMPTERPSVLSTFLGRITRNLAINRFEKRMRQKRGGGETPLALDELAECVPSDADPGREIELRELQEVFVARYWYLASVEEISRRLGWTRSRTKSLLFRLRKRLRAFLEEEALC